jgi:RimJ/RimL family protein N-acetyltransferase
MVHLPNSVEVAVELLTEKRFAEFGWKLAGLVYEKRRAYALRRDLHRAFVPPKAKIPIAVREFQESDIAFLLPEDRGTVGRKESIELATRRAHLEAGIPQCYVAIDARDGTPCYFQWLMGPQQNDKIQAHFGAGWFPVLKPDEAILENAYTPVAYRGKGIMSEAMARIAERANGIGCRYVMTFVEVDNIASLKGCQKAGFAPHLLRTESRACFHLIRKRTLVPVVQLPATLGPVFQATAGA